MAEVEQVKSPLTGNQRAFCAHIAGAKDQIRTDTGLPPPGFETDAYRVTSNF